MLQPQVSLLSRNAYRPENLTWETPATEKQKIKFQVQFPAPWYDQKANISSKETQGILPTNMALSPNSNSTTRSWVPFFQDIKIVKIGRR